jgi:hypothetical protein
VFQQGVGEEAPQEVSANVTTREEAAMVRLKQQRAEGTRGKETRQAQRVQRRIEN